MVEAAAMSEVLTINGVEHGAGPLRCDVASFDVGSITLPVGRTVHRYGARVEIRLGPSDGPAVRDATVVPQSLTLTQRLGVEARMLRSSETFVATKQHRMRDGESWDLGGCTSASSSGEDVRKFDTDVAGVPEAGFSERLAGSVAVGVIIVSGPTRETMFDVTEQVKVTAEIQEGLSWLATFDTRRALNFHHHIRVVDIDVQPDWDVPDLEQHWRDPVLGVLGFLPGLAGVWAYLEWLRNELGTQWAYCAFIVKNYPLHRAGYATIGGPRLVIDAAGHGWGEDNLDRVFVHETGHIFQCPDEYAKSGCTCDERWGRFGEPNVNCENCADPPSVACIMRRNEWTMCRSTKRHLGWTEWSEWGPLGAPTPGFVGTPHSVERDSQTCDVYVQGRDGGLWQLTWAGGVWGDWFRHDDEMVLGSDPVPGTLGPLHAHIFVRGTDGHVWQKWVDGTGWSPWGSLGAPPVGFVGAPHSVERSPGACNVYVRGADGALWQRPWWPYEWGEWIRHDDGMTLASEPVGGTLAVDHEHVYAVGLDGQLWQKWWVDGTDWSPWGSLGAPPRGIVGAPHAVERSADACSVYVRDGDGRPYQRTWLRPHWGEWIVHDDQPIDSDPVPGTLGPHHEHLFARRTDGQLWQKWWMNWL